MRELLSGSSRLSPPQFQLSSNEVPTVIRQAGFSRLGDTWLPIHGRTKSGRREEAQTARAFIGWVA